MNLFQFCAFLGFLGGAMAGVCHGKQYGPWGLLLGGVLGGMLGFLGGIVLTPIVLLFGYVMDKLERRIGPFLRVPIVLKRPRKSKEARDTK